MTRVVPFKPELDNGKVQARASVESGGRRFEIAYRFSRGPIAETSTAYLAATLIPAMRAGENLKVEGTVSPKLLATAPAIQGILSKWFPRTRGVEVDATPDPETKSSGAACFFSGGVDSFYSTLRHLDEIDALVFVHGFDIQPRHVGLRRRISASLRAAAEALDKPLIEVETNVRSFSDEFALWSEEYHGSALASVALMLSPQFGRFYIPASFPPRYSAPWGSHKDVDPLWGSEAVEIVHDGAEASRVDKARFIGDSEVAMRFLRVCWENRNGNYNCGRCEKCVRTMVNLSVVGALQRSMTLPHKLDLSLISRMPIPDECARIFIEDNLEAAKAAGDIALAAAIAASLERKQGGFSDRLRRGDLRGRMRRRLTRVMRQPLYDWSLPEPFETWARAGSAG